MDASGYQRILDAALDAVVLMDDRGRITDWNEQAVRIFGWTKQEAVGRLLASLIIPDGDRDAHTLGLDRYLQSRQGRMLNRRLDVTAVRKGGEEFPVELSITAVAGENGKPVFAGFVRDLSLDRRARRQSSRQTLETRLLQQASALAAGEESVEDGLRTCLHALCSITGWPVGHVWQLSSAGTHLDSTDIWYMSEPGIGQEIEQRSRRLHVNLGEGLPGRIWESHEAIWTTGPEQDSRLSADTENKTALRSGFGFPVLVNGDVAAVLEFFTSEPVTPDPALLMMVQTVGNLLGNAIERRRWQEERVRLAAIVDSSYDAIIGQDLHGTIISWNAGAEMIYGYSEEEAIGQPMGLIVPPEKIQEESEIETAVRSGQQLTQFETTRRRKDGRLVEISLTVSPIRDSKGRLVGASTIERDITELKHALHDLQEREERLRLLMESTGEAIYGLNMDGRCTFANNATARTLGYDSPRELLGMQMHELMHHHYSDGAPYPLADCPVYKVLQGGPEVHITGEVFFRRNGTAFPAEYWCSPIKRGRQIVGSVVVFEDVTGRLEAARMKGELAAIVETSSDAIIGKTLDGRVTSWNNGAERLYGYPAEEILGQTLLKILPPDRDDEEPELLDVARNGTRVLQLETVRRHRDGRLLNVAITASPIRDSQGRLVGTATIERDITSRIRREEELNEARLAAEQANQAKSEFLANISHELRTPMNGVLGMLQLALGEDVAHPLRDYLKTAKDSAETLLLLLNDLLDLSRLEAGRFELDAAPFRLRETLDAALKTLAVPAHQKGIELVFDVDADVPDTFIGDGFRLRQVITNLTGNAVKFTDRGEVVLTVRKVESTDDSAVVEFAVKDTGIGITAADQARIFQPFTQVDASSTRQRSGTGLGLAICQELVTKMNGRIWLESRLGSGSTFYFTAKFRIDHEQETAAPEVPELAGVPVLIVDDNHSSLKTLSTMLADWSMQPIAISNGHAALDLLREKRQYGSPIPLVIVDALMPELDGFALIKSLQRETEKNRVATILMASPADRMTFKRRCDELEIAAFLEKPVSHSDLLDSIMTALKGPQYRLESFSQVRPTSLRSLRILVVEDTAANQQVVQAILNKRGHQVSIANNGREAVNRVAQGDVDIVLMDVQMPIMDGFQATQAIREMSAPLSRVPIIAMTAHARREDRRKCLAAGMDAYISKPIDAEKLYRVVESFAGDAPVPPVRMVDSVDNMDVLRSTNLAAALDRLGGDEDLLKTLAQCFLEDSGPLLVELEEAVQKKDARAAERAAHSLKGLASNFDATMAVQYAARIELLARDKQLGDIAPTVHVLRNHLRDVCQELKDAILRMSK